MTWHKVNFSCGHEERVQIYGQRKERMQRIQWFRELGLCPNCLQRRRDNDRKNAAYLRKELWDYPELKGTSKQINWAYSVRLRIICDIEKTIKSKLDDFVSLSPEQREHKKEDHDRELDSLLRFKDYALEQEIAGWWIDRKDDGITQLLNEWINIGEPDY